MKKLLLIAAIFAGAAQAQVIVTTPGTRPASMTPNWTMPAGKIYIDRTTIPNGRPGTSALRVLTEGSDGRTSTGGGDPSGQFRIGCALSHLSFDDPIVWPGEPGRTHLHAFYGNTSTSSASDVANMATVGNSTCAGGVFNRSGYWTPPFVYHRPGHPRHGEVLAAPESNFYYKTAISGTSAPTEVLTTTWPLPGHRMIAGNPNNTGAVPSITGRFDCAGPGGTTPFDHIPTTAEATALGAGGCDEIIVLIHFPECWNGVDLDEPVTHAGHMASPDFFNGCTDPAFPVLFPTVSFNLHYPIANLADLDYYRLASDAPAISGYPAGHSLHGDWLNGWREVPMVDGKSVTTTILEKCVRGGFDCHNHYLGNPDSANPGVFYRLY